MNTTLRAVATVITSTYTQEHRRDNAEVDENDPEVLRFILWYTK